MAPSGDGLTGLFLWSQAIGGAHVIEKSNLRIYALLSTIAAWVVIAIALLTVVLIAFWFSSETRISPVNPFAIGIGLASILGNTMFMLAAIPLLLWVYTAHANLRAVGVTGLRHSPAWATFSFLVPIANLFVPFVAMRELANRSAGEPAEFAESTVDDVTSWWSCLIVGSVMGAMVAATVLVDAVPGLYVTTPIEAVMALRLFSLLLNAGSAYFLVKVIRQVTQNQLSGSAEGGVFE